MGFTVPNGPDAATVDQAEPDALDYEALAVRNTGVFSGCSVAAQGTPDMSVVVTAGKALVDGAPITVASGTVSIQTSEANARFDLIVADNAGAKSAVKGVASGTNPVFPSLDLSLFTLLAAVYVGASTSSIANSAIVDKRITMHDTFLVDLAADADPFLEATSPSGVFSVRADGKTTWVDSVLSRTGVTAMEWVTALTLKASESINSIFTVKARVTSPDTQLLLDLQTSGGSTVASISGTGVLKAANFLSGSGTPVDTVTADKGSLYVDLTTPRNGALWIKEGTSGTTDGWEPFRSFDPSDEAIPIGTIAPFIGQESSIPGGWLGINGQMISTTDDATKELASIVGGIYGTGAGVVGLPDFRGRIPVGTGGDVALSIGEVTGAVDVTLSEANLPAHAHDVVDPGHAHPKSGRGVYTAPSGSLHPTTDANQTFAILQDELNADESATTGISLSPTGSAEPFSALPPVNAVTWMVKARSAGNQANADGSDGLWDIDDLDLRYLQDTGDRDIKGDLASSWDSSDSGTAPLILRRSGNLVTLGGRLDCTAATDDLVYALLDGFRASVANVTTGFGIVAGNTTVHGYLNGTTDIRLSRTSNSNGIRFSMSWFTDDTFPTVYPGVAA